MNSDYYLKLGRNIKQFFTLPGKWTVEHFVESREEGESPSASRLTTQALAHPVGTVPFEAMISRAKRLAIIVDDATRPTPVEAVIEVLLDRLAAANFPPEHVTIVIALGTHARMEQEAVSGRLGSGAISRCKVVQHDAWQADLVPVTIPGDNRVVKINPEVARADVRIGISSILPHPMAGYGGGPKILMPGVSDFEFIRDHHMTHTIHPRALAGLIKGNPFQEDVMRTASAIGLDLSINCVYDREGQLADIIAGSLEAAFTKAVEACFVRLGHSFERKVDVTITSAYPHSHGHQFAKGLAAAEAITKDTGAILMVASLATPVRTEFLNSFTHVREMSSGNPRAYVTAAMSQGRAFLPDKPVDFNMAMSSMILRRPIRTIVVSPMIPPDQASIMGFEHASSLDEGIGMIEAAFPEASVAILPSGGLVVPIVS